MPYYRPPKLPSAYLNDTRNGLPSAQFYRIPQEAELFGYEEATGTAFSTTNRRSGAVLGNGTILTRESGATNNHLVDLSTFSQSALTATYSYGSRRIAPFGDTAFSNGSYNSARIEFFDQPTQTWLTNRLYWFPLTRYLCSLFQVNGYLYAVGGSANSAGYGADANTIYRLKAADYALSDNTAPNPPGWVSPWTAMTPPPVAMGSPTGCVSYDKNSIHILRYQNASGTIVNNWYEYNIITDTWTDHGVSTGILYNGLQLSNGAFIGFSGNGILGYYDGALQETNLGSFYGFAMTGDVIYDEYNDVAYVVPITPTNHYVAKFNPFMLWAVNYAR